MLDLTFNNGGAQLAKADYPGYALIIPMVAGNSTVMAFLRSVSSTHWYFSGINAAGGYYTGTINFSALMIKA